MAACAAFGLKAAYAGAVGTDENARRVEAALASRGVDLSLLVRRPGGNQFAAILIDNDSGERIVLWDRPDSLRLADTDLPAEALRSARAVLVDDVDPRASLEAARIASGRRRGGYDGPGSRDAVHRAADPHGVPPDPVGAPAAGVDWGGGSGARAAPAARVEPGLADGDRRRARGGGPRWRPFRPSRWVPRGQAVDTTGSGDVFRGAFIAGLLQGLPTEDLLRFANAAAAVSCTKAGALDGVPTPRTKLQKLLQ